MNLEKLFEMQKMLDRKIHERFPELDGQNNMDWKILALLTEIGECANEWRGFKMWSEDREPRAKAYSHHEEKRYEGGGFSSIAKYDRNPLLEEYVDSLHFILSIGLELGQEKYVENINHYIYEEPYMTNDVTLQFNYVFSLATKVRKQYKPLFSCFVALGEMLGFTWEEIESAYSAKNEINHARQDTNY
ncbi:dUTP diphosphatase [Sporosarcina sp. FSL K6-2383]|uniref:dUTP diphosphatase n=1 Tax=Sporosarcina sp. FSL K6-2383 TaxID=2921556 RepID=UPI003159D52F